MVSPLSFTQTTQLRPLTFIFTSGRANTTAYLSPAKSPPHVALPHIRKKMKDPKSIAGRPRCAKDFADNLSVISANKANHQSTLDTIQHRSASFDLILKPPKCLSYCFSGKSSVPDLCFRLGDNHTVNVSTKPAKFLMEEHWQYTAPDEESNFPEAEG